jgi:hypothetical protein
MCMGYVGCGARGSCSMIGWLCCLGLSEGAQVGTGSSPWDLLSDRWPVRSQGILIIACRGRAVFLQCSSVLRVANPSDRGLPTCEYSPSFRATPAILLRCSGWHSTCRMYLWWDGRCSSVEDQICKLPTATLFNQWHAKGQELSMFIMLEWGCKEYLVTKV